MYKISVIIPAYNAALYLPASLDSCLQQTFTDYEVIVINDGSTDNTLLVANNYVRKNPFIKVISKDNEGLVMARRTGIAEAKANFIFFLDADDVIEPDTLQLLYDNIQNADVAIGNVIIEHEDGTPFKRQKQNKFKYGHSNKEMICNYLSKNISHAIWGRLFRKSVLEGIETPPDITVGEDGITTYLIWGKQSIRVTLVEKFLYHYIQRDGSMINTVTPTNRAQRAKYIKWLFNYFKLHLEEKNISMCLSYNVMNEYYSYLRDGGNPNEDYELYDIVLKQLWNNKALKELDVWQQFMLKSFKCSTLLGLIYRRLFITIRNSALKIR